MDHATTCLLRGMSVDTTRAARVQEGSMLLCLPAP